MQKLPTRSGFPTVAWRVRNVGLTQRSESRCGEGDVHRAAAVDETRRRAPNRSTRASRELMLTVSLFNADIILWSMRSCELTCARVSENSRFNGSLCEGSIMAERFCYGPRPW